MSPHLGQLPSVFDLGGFDPSNWALDMRALKLGIKISVILHLFQRPVVTEREPAKPSST